MTTKTKALNRFKLHLLHDEITHCEAAGNALQLTDLMAKVKFIKEWITKNKAIGLPN